MKSDNAQIDYQQFFKSLHLEGEVSNTLMSVFTSHFNTVSGAPSISKYAFCPFFVVRWKMLSLLSFCFIYSWVFNSVFAFMFEKQEKIIQSPSFKDHEPAERMLLEARTKDMVHVFCVISGPDQKSFL